MIPTPQTGKMKKLDQATFRGEGWELVTDSEAIESILTAIGVKDDDYCSLSHTPLSHRRGFWLRM